MGYGARATSMGECWGSSCSCVSLKPAETRVSTRLVFDAFTALGGSDVVDPASDEIP